MRLGDLDALKEALDNVQYTQEFCIEHQIDNSISMQMVGLVINNAPTVEPEETCMVDKSNFSKEQYKADIDNAYNCGYEKGKNSRPQGEREFIKIIARYEPDDLCTYPEYRGKPYYSILYRENGEKFIGYGTYKIEVLSMYLRTYFFNADMRDKEE